MQTTVIRCVAVAGAILFLSGCASLGNGERQQLPMNSEPSGATASWDGQAVTTPGVFVVHRKSRNVSIRFEKPGYQTCVLHLTRERDGAFWANLALIPAGLALGGYVGYSSASDKTGWFAGWGEAIIGGLVGGAAMPLAAMAVDAGNGRGYEQTPGKLSVLLTSVEPGHEVDPATALPLCAAGDLPKKQALGGFREAVNGSGR